MGSVDFDAARRERQKHHKPIEFTLGGQTFRCVPTIPTEVALGVLVDDRPRPRSEVLADAVQFVEDCLVNGHAKRWRTALTNRAEPLEDVDVFAVVRWLLNEYCARPTKPSPASARGRRTTGARSSSKGSGSSRAKGS